MHFSTGIAKVALVAGAVGLAGCGATVRPGQRGLEYHPLRKPALAKTPKREGFYWLFPWNGIVTYDVTWRSQTERIEILTADDLHVSTDVTVTFRPQADRIYDLHTQFGPAYYEKLIRPVFVALARSEFARHKHNDLAKDEPRIEGRILDGLRESVAAAPVEIDRVSMAHVEYDRNVSAAISAKLATEQKVEQKEAEARIAQRDADIQRTAARGRSDAVRIEAEGEAAALVLKGEAQAKAQREISKTLTPSYLRYKAFDSSATRYYFVPTGKDGMPIILNAEPSTPNAPARSGTGRP